MPELKFHCPECNQRIGVDPSAKGEKIDCPRCRSTIVIPTDPRQPVQVEVRRKLANLPGANADLYAVIEKLQADSKRADDEIAAARSETQKVLADFCRISEELAASQREREALASRVAGADAAREAANAAQVQLAELRMKVGDLKSANDSLRERAEQAETSSNASRERLVNYEKERAELRAQATALQAQLERAQNPSQAQRIDALETNIARLEQQICKDRAERESLTAIAASSAAEVDKLRRERAELQTELDALKAYASRGFPDQAEAERCVAEARAWAAKLSREVADLQRLHDAMRVERDQALQEAHAIGRSRDDLRARLSEREAALVKASLSGEAMRHELERLRQKLEAMPTQGELQRANELADKLAAMEKQCEESRAALAAATTERDHARQQVREQQSALEEALGKANTAGTELTRLEHALTTATAASEKARRESHAVMQHVAFLEKDLRKRDSEITALREEIASRSATPDTSELDSLRAAHSALEGKLAAALEAESTYQALLENAEHVLKEGDAQIRSLTAERDRIAIALQGATAAQGRGLGGLQSDLASQKAALEAQIEKAEAKLRQNADYIGALEQEHQQLRAEFDALRSALDRAREQVNRLQSHARRDGEDSAGIVAHSQTPVSPSVA